MDESAGRPVPAGMAQSDPGRPTISTHVLDTASGQPAEGIHVTLWRVDGGTAPGRMTQALTDSDGRVRDLLDRPLVAGEYRLDFAVPADRSPFFARLTVDFRITDTSRSYHVPLLLSPFGLSTYRGS
ncbi:MAG TPA: hydroxyisourate hydrolase [Candidatus Limnocylindrales bacterium]|nr:hydroxyisourate hydrolase [Candidatus Limnocylindrales bacterium]